MKRRQFLTAAIGAIGAGLAWPWVRKAVPDLYGKPCGGGLDLSNTEDMTVLSLVVPAGETVTLKTGRYRHATVYGTLVIEGEVMVETLDLHRGAIVTGESVGIGKRICLFDDGCPPGQWPLVRIGELEGAHE